MWEIIPVGKSVGNRHAYTLLVGKQTATTIRWQFGNFSQNYKRMYTHPATLLVGIHLTHMHKGLHSILYCGKAVKASMPWSWELSQYGYGVCQQKGVSGSLYRKGKRVPGHGTWRDRPRESHVLCTGTRRPSAREGCLLPRLL